MTATTQNLKQQFDAFCAALGPADASNAADALYIPQMIELQHTISLAFRYLVGVQMRHVDWKIVSGLGTDNREQFLDNLADYIYGDIIKGDDDAKVEDVRRAVGLIADHVHVIVEGFESYDSFDEFETGDLSEVLLSTFQDKFMCPENPAEEVAGLAERAEMSTEDFMMGMNIRIGTRNSGGSYDETDEPHGEGSAPVEKGRRLNDRYEVRVNGEKVEGSSRIDHATRKYGNAVEQHPDANVTLFDLKDGECLADSDEDDPTI